ncbi:MAG TPA: hypothetical protein VFF69_11770 [Phycisphaerales bacterium]|nr:hypothetical protein [Phycisphaerales bacterium]
MQAPDPPLCAGCGYDLSGTPIVEHSLTCPECGGNRVRVPRWYEPCLSWRRSWLYLPGALAVGAPGAALASFAGAEGVSLTRWLLLGVPPYLWLGCVLAFWRPGLAAGVTTLGLAAVLATLLGGIAWAASLLPVAVSPVVVIPLEVLYFVLPTPLGILWAQSILDDTPDREAGL